MFGEFVPPLSLQEKFAGVVAQAVVEPVETSRVCGGGCPRRGGRSTGCLSLC